MGPAVGHYLHRDHQGIDLNPPRAGMPSASEDLGSNAERKLLVLVEQIGFHHVPTR